MSSEIRVSIIIPIYKSKSFLPLLFDHLLKQTLSSIEIITVNDGSPDESGSICEEYSATDRRIKVIHKQNGGAASAVQRGLDESVGEYVMFLDADDWIEYETCEVAYNAALKERADLVFWGYYKEFPGRQAKVKTMFDAEVVFDEQNINWLRRRFYGLLNGELKRPTETDAISMVWAKLYKSKLLKENGIRFIDTQDVGSTDVIFNMQVARFLQRAVYVNKYLNHYRQDNPTSLTKNYQFTLLDKYLRLFTYAMKEVNVIEESSCKAEVVQSLSNRIVCSLINISLSANSKHFEASQGERLNYLKRVLNSDIYIESLNRFQSKFLPIEWKLFFFLAKRKKYLTFYVFTRLIYDIRLFKTKVLNSLKSRNVMKKRDLAFLGYLCVALLVLFL